MPFVVIKGHFCPELGNPDGDSVRFRADNNVLWSRLQGRHARLSQGGATLGTVQLRLEGIDSIEKEATKPLATDSTASLKALIGHSAGTREPRGHILARMTDDQSGRPIAFAFAGDTAEEDGADMFLSAALLERSVNHGQARAGFAYPLYYNTLFADLRRAFDAAIDEARGANRGYWPQDATLAGVTVHDNEDLEDVAPIWPKLWRRLREHLGAGRPLSGFKDWLEDRNERIDILSLMEEQGFQDVVEVSGQRVRMTVPPHDIRVVGDAGQRPRR